MRMTLSNRSARVGIAGCAKIGSRAFVDRPPAFSLGIETLLKIAGVNRGRRTAPWAAGLHARLLWPLYGPLAMRAVARQTATARPQLPHHGIAKIKNKAYFSLSRPECDAHKFSKAPA